ncbi:MAG: ferrochelatase [Euryarchaeota archaeon]|nr:ferrochelatase [Euryarchaeota archaeon]|tara:strand:- start:5480 stop:6508 length:1029 start_codon:yes stop_codon:yes gene_type:complete
MGRDGILLMNVGTPDEPTTNSVKIYLREFLLDPDVIDIPTPLRHLLVRGIILRTRPKKIAPRYKSIWMEEGSPLRVYTQRICDKLQIRMEDSSCEVGMRYGNPSIRSALESLREQGVTRLLLAPLFPHYAQATTESSVKHAYNQLSEMDWTPEILEFGHFETENEYISPLAESIRPHLSPEAHLLFSYHGLPVSHVKRIDSSKKHCQKVNNCCDVICDANALCYGRHCSETTSAVVEKLGLTSDQWSMSYQSRLGPVKWLEPSTTNKVEELVQRGVKNIVVVAPAFLADGLETLEELDIELREDFIEMGGDELTVVKCLNDNDYWIDGLEALVRRRLEMPLA